jgi:spore coat polysaccharide biosynthesis predicted glycosyltransferase SpsG
MLSRGHEVTYLTTTPAHVQRVCPTAVETVEIQSRTDPDLFVEWLSDSTADAVFTDAYPADTNYQRAVQSQVPLVVLQDDAGHAICADILINSNVYATELNYEFVGKPPITHFGPDYLLIRSDVRRAAAKDPVVRNEPKRIVVTMGGSDVTNYTPSVVRTLSGLPVTVEVIVGPGYGDTRSIERAVKTTPGTFEIVSDPPNLPERFRRADVAVTATGTTTYELLAVGTPVVGIPQVENQVPIAESLATSDTILTVDPDSPNALSSAVERVLHDRELRTELCARGRELVDCRGHERVSEAILRLT